MTTTIDKRALYCQQLIAECLSTHNELNQDDIKLALQVDFSKFEDEKLALIIIHLCKNTDIGRFSLLFNYNVDLSIIRKDMNSWIKLLQLDNKQMFPEYYNQEFTTNEREYIIKIYTLEYNSALRLIKEIDDMEIPFTQYLIQSCPTLKKSQSRFRPLDPEMREIISSQFQPGTVSLNGLQNTTVYQKCMEGVCIEEEMKGNIDFVPRTNNSQSLVYVPSILKSDGGKIILKSTECYDFMELIAAISFDPAFKPHNKEEFSPNALNMLRKRLAKEIKMYRYYITELQKAGLVE